MERQADKLSGKQQIDRELRMHRQTDRQADRQSDS